MEKDNEWLTPFPVHILVVHYPPPLVAEIN